jgi:hypothetical protein
MSGQDKSAADELWDLEIESVEDLLEGVVE